MNNKALLVVLILSLSILSGCIKEKAQNQPPSCSLHAFPSIGYGPPLDVEFLLNASDSDGYIVSWQFDVDGDGITDYSGNGSELPKKIHYLFLNTEDYYPCLTVMDNNGLISNKSIHIRVCKNHLLKLNQ